MSRLKFDMLRFGDHFVVYPDVKEIKFAETTVGNGYLYLPMLVKLLQPVTIGEKEFNAVDLMTGEVRAIDKETTVVISGKLCEVQLLLAGDPFKEGDQTGDESKGLGMKKTG